MTPRFWSRTGFTSFTTGALFGFAETWYFGFNMLPGSQAEVICDAVASAFMILGAVLLVYSSHRVVEDTYKYNARTAQLHEMITTIDNRLKEKNS